VVTAGRALITLGIVIIVGLAGFAILAWRAEIDPVQPVQAGNFDAALVQRGGHLAAIGNCITCHTAENGEPLAGGLAVSTPFGKLYSTNITPDAETGIGRWPEEAFRRAMQEGVDREGRHLYPAFPYDHFTKVTDEDNRALYAFLMTRTPVRASPPPNELRFPFNLRVLIAGWKLLYFDEGRFVPDPQVTAQWNRGAYIVQGLAHCGACHTPRNALGAERKEAAYSGGESEGWHAYAINALSPAPIPWDEDSLSLYLRRGWHELHGVSRGPMAPVTANLGSVPGEDVRAIATYVASLMGPPSAERVQKAQMLRKQIADSQPRRFPGSSDSQAVPTTGAADTTPAAVTYIGACAICHEGGRPLPYGGLHLGLSSGIHGSNARNVINVILEGLPPAEGERSSLMPGYAGVMNDEQLISLVQYLRSRFSDKDPWQNVPELVRERRGR
jgi:mono/diheme cytochrome c family protein